MCLSHRGRNPARVAEFRGVLTLTAVSAEEPSVTSVLTVRVY